MNSNTNQAIGAIATQTVKNVAKPDRLHSHPDRAIGTIIRLATIGMVRKLVVLRYRCSEMYGTKTRHRLSPNPKQS